MCLKFCQLSSLASKKEFTRALTSAAFVVIDSVLLNKNSFFIFLISDESDQVVFQSGRLVQLNASLERALLDFGANLLSHISSHVVNPSANGVITAESVTC